MKANKQFALLDVCYPDYFSGYHRTVIGVNLDPVMNNKDIADSLKLELNYIDTDFSKTEYLIVEEFINSLMDEPDAEYWRDDAVNMEDAPEDYQTYAYYSLIKPVYAHGLMFLDR